MPSRSDAGATRGFLGGLPRVAPVLGRVAALAALLLGSGCKVLESEVVSDLFRPAPPPAVTPWGTNNSAGQTFAAAPPPPQPPPKPTAPPPVAPPAQVVESRPIAVAPVEVRTASPKVTERLESPKAAETAPVRKSEGPPVGNRVLPAPVTDSATDLAGTVRDPAPREFIVKGPPRPPRAWYSGGRGLLLLVLGLGVAAGLFSFFQRRRGVRFRPMPKKAGKEELATPAGFVLRETSVRRGAAFNDETDWAAGKF